MSTPCSVIEFYKVPALSPNYRDSYYFNNATVQYNFFHSTTGIKTLSNSQFTRITNNKVKVPYPQTEMIEFNYMLIKNARGNETTTPTGKSFYCFITNVEYVSDMCSLITFEVDVIQTFIVNATLKESFVERCHADSDNLNEHREPEPFTIENYTADASATNEYDFYCFVGIVAGTEISYNGQTYDRTTETHTYSFRGNTSQIQTVYSGVEYLGFDLNASSQSFGGADLQRMINKLIIEGKTDAIVDMFAVPKCAYTDGFVYSHSVKDVITGTTGYVWNLISLKPSAGTQISGYTPTNNKLYNYPYSFLRIINAVGDTLDLKWEEFSSNPSLEDYGSWYGGGNITSYAYGYEGISGANRNYKITLTNFPEFPFINDIYKEWKAQKMGSEILSSGLGFVGGTVASLGLAAINPVLGALSEARTVGSLISNDGGIVAEAIEADKKPNEVKNYKTTPENAICTGMFNLCAFRMSLSKPEAEQIDNFFTMFGYALNKVINVRTYLNNSKRAKFCYIKTKGFSVQGNFPSEYKTKFNEVFNSGITFWKTNATVGDYSNNNIVTP